MNRLFAIPARDEIGRAKNEAEYKENLTRIGAQMREQIAALIAKGGEQL
jgi:hypothetical protein